jgi:hypothetical protein
MAFTLPAEADELLKIEERLSPAYISDVRALVHLMRERATSCSTRPRPRTAGSRLPNSGLLTISAKRSARSKNYLHAWRSGAPPLRVREQG